MNDFVHLKYPYHVKSALYQGSWRPRACVYVYVFACGFLLIYYRSAVLRIQFVSHCSVFTVSGYAGFFLWKNNKFFDRKCGVRENYGSLCSFPHYGPRTVSVTWCCYSDVEEDRNALVALVQISHFLRSKARLCDKLWTYSWLLLLNKLDRQIPTITSFSLETLSMAFPARLALVTTITLRGRKRVLEEMSTSAIGY